MFRFLHSSDLHLGKPFGRMPEDLRGRLREARFRQIETLAGIAEREGVTHILLAGDTFDAETPSPATRRQALQAMARDRSVTWVILPGNHDSLAADELWRTIAAEDHPNVTLVLEAAAIPLAEGVTLLPAPCPARRSGRDLTDWMDGAETNGIRIGLAHGGVQSFSEDVSAETIAPDRADRAQLDYLALGDWHGQVSVTPRTWYSGTPEADRFKHDAHASALLVSIAAPGAMPDVESTRTGNFLWDMRTLDLVPDTDPDLEGYLPAPEARRDTLLRMTLTGRTRPDHRAALLARLTDAEPDFALLEWSDHLAVNYDADDLDRIDRAGVLRSAAEALAAEMADDALSAEDRDTARRALNRLYSFAVETV